MHVTADTKRKFVKFIDFSKRLSVSPAAIPGTVPTLVQLSQGLDERDSSFDSLVQRPDGFWSPPGVASDGNRWLYLLGNSGRGAG